MDTEEEDNNSINEDKKEGEINSMSKYKISQREETEKKKKKKVKIL